MGSEKWAHMQWISLTQKNKWLFNTLHDRMTLYSRAKTRMCPSGHQSGSGRVIYQHNEGLRVCEGYEDCVYCCGVAYHKIKTGRLLHVSLFQGEVVHSGLIASPTSVELAGRMLFLVWSLLECEWDQPIWCCPAELEKKRIALLSTCIWRQLCVLGSLWE